MFETKLIVKNYFIRKKLRKNTERVSSQVSETKNLKPILATITKIIFLCLLGCIVLLPFFMMLSISFMPDNEVEGLKKTFHLLPSFGPGQSYFNEGSSTYEHGINSDVPWADVVANTYKKAFSSGYGTAILFTSLNVVISVILKVIIVTLMGYAFSLRNWRGKNIIFSSALALLVLPEVALLYGQKIVITQLGITATYVGFLFAVALPFVASIFNGLMYKNAFESIPGRIKEVSLIDGAAGWKYLFKVAIPMVVPTTLTVVILTALASWNAYLWPLSIKPDSIKVEVISVWLFKAGLSDNSSDQPLVYYNVKMAASLIAIFPMMLVYFIFRKYIMRAIGRQGSTIKG
ncbi:carbohydrate ABC transporter permease [Mycoplasmopsis ciconiae]|uniref:Carbohydrate ABC transporter permease n=1 Tax=Mycoplasmopsis ciconiae TaxID=561067 RepID=A0ABU7MLD9_9BACT|nr:carbohydrate ABC transporter permease [Mycoplasmopsis ciconiae]